MRLQLIYILLFLSLGTRAQLMDWGVPQKLASRNLYCTFIGFNNDGYYYMRCKKPDFKNEVMIEKYSHSLRLIWSKTITNEHFGESIQNVLLMKNKLIVLTASDNYTSGFTEVKATSINFEGLIAKQYTPLFQLKTSGFYRNEEEATFTFKINLNDDVFVACYLTQAEKKQVGLNYLMFNDEFNTVGSGGFAYTAKTERFFINDIVIYKLHVYSLVSYYETIKKNQDDIYVHDLIIMNNTLKTSYKVPIILEGKTQSDIAITIDSIAKTLQLTGFYSEKKSTSAAGVAVYTVPLANPENYHAAFTPFPKEMLSKIIGQKASERTNEMEDFVVRQLVPRSDGGMVLIAECFYIEKQAYNAYTSGIQGVTPQPTMFRNVYNYDEVLVFSLEPNATIDWWQAIIKKQTSLNDDGYNLSIATLIKKEMLYVFFNQHYNNSNQILEYQINGNGRMNNKILFKSSNYYVDFAPRQSCQIANGSLLMPFIKDRKFNLLKLTY